MKFKYNAVYALEPQRADSYHYDTLEAMRACCPNAIGYNLLTERPKSHYSMTIIMYVTLTKE